ncbi:hypothetical protein U9M48_007730 [Paspalum notatum var. saurae]|uniref:PRISE-like Rossmann-fold domain-containing protein n=1 Tax=Paspalum notatum var. saurae TaxID=547442 RepID=A0AAQ3SN11_PASNO
MNRWWCAGAAGAVRKHHGGHAAASNGNPFESVALVVGSTGIVGASLVDILPLPDTPGGPWKVYALSRRPPPPWHPPSSSPSSVTHIHVDLTDSAAVAEALAPLTDITHVFYVAWSSRPTEAQNRDTNTAMLRNVLSAVVPNCPALAHVSLQTGTKHYVGAFEAIGNIPAVLDPPYTEDMPRLDCPNFYYDQEDILVDAVRQSGGASAGAVSWSVHRPRLIFGFAPRSAMNIVCSLCVYASICRMEHAVLRWPGSRGAWEGIDNASDADLVAEQHIWAAVHPMAKNEAFNCSNGDVYTWKQLWPILAGRFGLEWVGYDGEEKRFRLTEAMAAKEAVWAEIVREKELVETRLDEVASWWLVDAQFCQFGTDRAFLDSMNKSKEHGFLGFRNTLKSFDTWIDKMKVLCRRAVMSLSWWWARSVGAARELHDEHAAVPEHQSFKGVALVVGSTGIVGASLVDILPLPDTPGGPWKVYALSRRPLPPWHPPSPSSVTHIHVDLTDSAAVAEALTPLTDITHVFYVALSYHTTEAKNREVNSGMLRNVLSVVVANCPALVHVSLQTGTKHYLGAPEDMGKIAIPDLPYTEDTPRRDSPNFYYDQEDILFSEVSQRGGAVSWSVHRPSLIFGFSPRSFFNIVCSLCVYAAICRKEGAKLRWPGSLACWEAFSNVSDADLVAEQQFWAAVDPMAKNEAFNCSNGDLHRWKMLWPILAGRFGLEWTGYDGEEKQFKVSEAMAGKEAVWAEIVRENGLMETRLGDVANWWFFDFAAHELGVSWKFLDSMNKSKEHGFLGFRNTVKSFDKWIDRMKAYKIVP